MQTVLLNTVTLPELADLVRKEFLMTQNMVKPAAMPLFIKDPIGKGKGNTKRYDEVDTQTYAKLKRQGEKSKKASVGIGYNVTMEKKRISIEIDITQEMLDENQYIEVGSLITSLSHYCPQRIDLDLTHIFTFCNASSYVDMDGRSNTLTTGDGYALAYTAHTLKFSSQTYSNVVSGAPVVSQGGLEAAEALTTNNILSNFGERRVMLFNTIVTSDDPNTVNNVKKVLESTADVDSSNSGVVNPYARKYRHVILPNLATTATGANDSTKKRWWFLLAAGQGTNGWQAYFGEWEPTHMKKHPDQGGSNEDFSADVITEGVRSGYGIRVASPRGFIASLAA